MKEFGAGPPLVLIPGIQGRWEWMKPAVLALAERHRVFTFSLGEATGPGLFEQWAAMIDAVTAGAPEGTPVVGVSFGGLVATYYAGVRPNRVSRLVLVSTPSPRWRLDPQSAGYARRPRLAMPLFALRGATRLYHEVRVAMPSLRRRATFATEHVARILLYPPSPVHMAQCVDAWSSASLLSLCERIDAPALLVTGEPRLDRVVPVASSLDYLSLFRNVRHVTLADTGHLGLVLRPREFAALVTDFVSGDAGITPATHRPDRRTAHSAPELARPGGAA